MTVEIGEELFYGDKGSEQLYEVLFTCELNEKKYLVAGLSEELDNEEADPDIISFSYTEDEEGTLFFDEIENEDEWKQVEAKYNAYIDQAEKEQ